MGGYRVIKPELNESLLEDTRTERKSIREQIALVTKENIHKYKWDAIKFGAGVLLVVIGVIGTGSFYGPTRLKLAGILANLFYNLMLGNVMIAAGTVMIYDAWMTFTHHK